MSRAEGRLTNWHRTEERVKTGKDVADGETVDKLAKDGRKKEDGKRICTENKARGSCEMVKQS